ncbi:MAG: acetolactate decarboxylase [Candidatus Thiosymbion ectosymbiont of Robbea hypermnestra]|nr:acetolactate decarboxylase [Candidatus Thiosymbion ectosymbiont of Robbea hypermnestra]
MNNDWMTDTVTQVSILNALLARRFDGCLPCRELLKYGDFGTGTYDRMDGEMILVDGRLYQAGADGKVHTPDPDNSTPFATVCRFRADHTWTLSESTNLEALRKMVDAKVSNRNVMCAIRVEGSFPYMKTHALQIQSEPYPPTAEVVHACVQHEMKDVSGTLVGFRGTPYLRGINDVGYHLHFLSDDKTQGGHVLEFVMERGDCAVDICGNHHVILPEDGAVLAGIDMKRDWVTEFHDALEALSE